MNISPPLYIMCTGRDVMKNSLSPPLGRGAALACFSLVGMFVFLGILLSYRASGSLFAESTSVVRILSAKDSTFAASFEKSFFNNLVFCTIIILFAPAFPLSFLSGILLLFKSFCLGAAVGLAAKACVAKEAMGIFFAVFISNFLVIPLKVLLFLSSVNFSLKSCELSASDKLRAYVGFVLKTCVFFVLMCISECIQLGIGVGIL